jgi:hypothetical protein
MEPNGRRPPDPTVESIGVPIARHDERGRRLRQHSERLARLSRYALALCGGVTAAAAGADLVLHPAPLAVGLGIFGLALIVLALVQHLLLLLERRRWPDGAFLWPDGIELLLHNGEVRAVEWTDPRLAFDLFRRPVRGDPEGEILLEWKMGEYIPPCPITEDGFHRIQASAVTHGLGMAEFRHGHRKAEVRIFEIRAARRRLSGGPPPTGASTTEI